MDELRRIDLNLLLTLHALLAERHVTRAALRLHKSQPAVSHALAQLRAHFGDPLLVRREGGLQLSARAQELLPSLTQALTGLDEVLRAPAFEAGTARRRLRLGMSDYAARLVLPPLMRRLRVHAPGIALAVSQAGRDTMLGQLDDGELDLALGVFPAMPEHLRRQRLFEERFVSVADAATVPARDGLSWEAWLARPHVLVAMRPDGDNDIDAAVAARGGRRRIALVLPHWSAALEVVAGTDLVLTVAARTLGAGRLPKGLRRFAPPLNLPAFAFEQAWHPRRDGDAALGWLREQLVEVCR